MNIYFSNFQVPKSDMILGLNKIGGNSERSEPNGAGGGGAGQGARSELPPPPPLAGGPREQSPLRKLLGFKTPLDWLKIGLNSTKKKAYIFENTLDH